MTLSARYRLAMALILLTLLLLVPGLMQNALTIRGVLDVGSIGATVDRIAGSQIPPAWLATIRKSLNQDTIAKFSDAELSEFIGRLAGGIVRGKLEGARTQLAAMTVYEQKQTILVTIRYLFQNGGYWAGTLLLLFSVCVPFGKVALFFHAIHARPERREKVLGFINFIGKWSMADVFVVAIYTAYLGAKNSVGIGQPVHFETEYGPGFYWFSAYCLVSLAAQQAAVALMRRRGREAFVNPTVR